MTIRNEKGSFHTYYVVNLSVDKLLRNSNGKDYGLSFNRKSGDKDFQLIKLNNGFCSYRLYHLDNKTVDDRKIIYK